jgi:hypothetical protein
MDPKTESEEKEVSLHDEIRAAMTGSEEKEEQPRGEDGKFATKEGETEVEAAARLEPAPKDKPVPDEKKTPGSSRLGASST